MDARPRLSRSFKTIATLVVLSILPAAAADVASQGRPPSAKDLDCPPATRGQVLQKEQASVLGALGKLTVLRDRADLQALAGPPYGFPALLHQFTSFEGVGLTVFSPTAQLGPGRPNFLFYAPSKGARNTQDPRGPDFPYTLAGWAYGVPYTPDRLPGFLPCIGAKDWHIHERGIHPYKTGGMIPMPPAEGGFGESAGQLSDPPALRPVVGFPHPRTWTAHFWRGRSGTPDSAILDPSDPPDGIDPGEGSSFYFLDNPPAGVLDPFANAGRPSSAQDGEGRRKVVGGNEFTLKAAGLQAGGAFSAIDATFRRNGRLAGSQAKGFYLLSGSMTFQAGGQRLPARKGSFVYVPGATRFEVGGAGGARALVVSVPGGLERALGFEPPPGAPAAPPAAARPAQQPAAKAAPRAPFALQPGEGEEVPVNGGSYVFKAKTEDTGGAFALMEITLPRGAGPGPHIHHRETEAFFVTKGEMTFQTGGQTIPAQRDQFVLLPRGLPHVYSVDTDESTFVLLAAPAGLEKFFRTLSSGPPTAAQGLRAGVEPVIPKSRQPQKKP